MERGKLVRKFLFIIVCMMYCFLLVACSNSASKPENRILGHWIEKSKDPDIPDTHYFIAKDIVTWVGEGKNSEIKYEIVETKPENNWIKIKYDAGGGLREFHFPPYSEQSQTESVKTSFEMNNFLTGEPVVGESTWEYADNKQKPDDPEMAAALVDQLYSTKETVNISLTEMKKQLGTDFYNFTWNEEAITPNTKVISARDLDGLLSVKAITYNQQLKKVSLTYYQKNDSKAAMKSMIGFIAFLQTAMPDVYYEEHLQWITKSFKQVQEVEGKAGHVSYKGQHYDWKYDDELKAIELSVIHDKSKTEDEKSGIPTFPLTPYQGIGITRSVFELFDKDVEYTLTDGSPYIRRKMIFLKEKDEKGRPVMTGKTARNDVILTVTGRDDNVKSAKMQIHKKVSELDLDIYFDRMWKIASFYNSTIKERPIPDKYTKWYEQAFEELLEKNTTQEAVVGDNIVTLSYEEPYYEFQIFINLNKE